MTRNLIDPSKFRIAQVTHQSGGIVLHDEHECPRDVSCPVYVALHSNLHLADLLES